jgi:hypothetical protein
MQEDGAPSALLERLADDPHSYFRALAVPFVRQTCAAFDDLKWELPSTMVHGDAHLEQFVVTQSTFGLEDFDRSGYGPAVVDLVRYATSLRLACRARGWSCDERVDRFLAGYRAGLTTPDAVPTAPSMVAVLRGNRRASTEEFLAWASEQMVALDDQRSANVRRAWEGFVRLMVDSRPDRGEAYYRLKSFGSLHMGIGSALVSKVLVRAEGPGPGELDDVILEAKLQDAPIDLPCVRTAPTGGMFRVILAVNTIGRRVPEVLGWVPLKQRGVHPVHYWVNSWDPGYRELRLPDLRTASDLDELGFDAGLQLGASVFRGIPAPVAPQVRLVHLRALIATEARVVELSRRLAEDVVTAWERYRHELAPLMPAAPAVAPDR